MESRHKSVFGQVSVREEHGLFRQAALEDFHTTALDVAGAWRSLVAHLLWEQGVAGSSPVAPTTSMIGRSAKRAGRFFVLLAGCWAVTAQTWKGGALRKQGGFCLCRKGLSKAAFLDFTHSAAAMAQPWQSASVQAGCAYAPVWHVHAAALCMLPKGVARRGCAGSRPGTGGL